MARRRVAGVPTRKGRNPSRLKPQLFNACELAVLPQDGKMSSKEIMDNPRADRVRAAAHLAKAAGRKKAGEFLVEGPQAVREAIVEHRTQRGFVREVFITEDRMEREPELAQVADARVNVVTDRVLAAIADTQSPQGVVARCRIPHTTLRQAVTPKTRLVAVLGRVQDPGNAGTIIRAADAAGADAVVALKGSVDVFSPKVVRSTVGSLFHVPVVTGVELEELTEHLTRCGIVLLAADGGGDHDLTVLEDDAAARRHGVTVKGSMKRPSLATATAWLFGNEGQGISDEERAASFSTVSIPLYGQAESLNVSTAATLCLYASARAQRS